MAKCRVMVGDTSSEVVAQMRRTLNGLLLMIETAEASITAGATAENVLDAWADAVRTGKDNNPAAIANVTSSNAEILGVKVTPRAPRGAVQFASETMTLDEV